MWNFVAKITCSKVPLQSNCLIHNLIHLTTYKTEVFIKNLVCGVAFICKPFSWFTVEINFLVSTRKPHKELMGYTHLLTLTFLDADHDPLFYEPANTI